MMTTALLRLSSCYKTSHTLKYLIRSTKEFINKVLAMQLQKPMVPLVLLGRPVTLHYVFHLPFVCLLFYNLLLLHLFLILLLSEPYLAFLPKQRLEVVSRYNFLILECLLISFDRGMIRSNEILKLDLRFNDDMRHYYFFLLCLLHSLYIC
jgi:hypothetical protein